MKRQWLPDELVEHFTLTPSELDLLTNRTGSTRLGFAVLLKCFQHEGRFPRYRYEVPLAVVDFVAQQLDLSAALLREYKWKGRSIKYHRAQIRDLQGYRVATSQDAEDLKVHLLGVALGQDPDFELLQMECAGVGPGVSSPPHPTASSASCVRLCGSSISIRANSSVGGSRIPCKSTSMRYWIPSKRVRKSVFPSNHSSDTSVV